MLIFFCFRSLPIENLSSRCMKAEGGLALGSEVGREVVGLRVGKGVGSGVGLGVGTGVGRSVGTFWYGF